MSRFGFVTIVALFCVPFLSFHTHLLYKAAREERGEKREERNLRVENIAAREQVKQLHDYGDS